MALPNDRAVAQRITQLLTDFLGGDMTREQVAARLKLLAGWVAKDVPQKTEEDPRIREVFDHWAKRTNRPTAKLTPDRRQRITARLREGYDVETLKKAIDHIAASPFHQGDNDRGKRYDDITVALQSGSKTERNAEQATEDIEVSPIRAELLKLKGIA